MNRLLPLRADRYFFSQRLHTNCGRVVRIGGIEPITKRFEANWQNDNYCAEVFLLSEVVDNVPGTDRGGAPRKK